MHDYSSIQQLAADVISELPSHHQASILQASNFCDMGGSEMRYHTGSAH